MRNPTDSETPVPPKTMTIKLPTGWSYGALIVVLSAWILNSFLQAMLAACVTAIASWPLYTRFAVRLPQRIGEHAGAYVDLATRAVRASVNSMLVVALFDGLASGIAYAIVGVPHAAVWAAVTGLLALVPFLGYVAVGALTLQLAMAVTTTPPVLALGLGCFVLFCGDKIVRSVVARDGIRLRFVWVLMGCLGGFEVLGLIGLVIGPVVLTLARELWEQHVRDLAAADVIDSPSQVEESA